MSHTGIRLKIEIPSGVILEGDSDWLHLMAVFANRRDDLTIGPDTPAELLREAPADEPWHEVLRTSDGLTISVQPVTLADEYPDDES